MAPPSTSKRNGLAPNPVFQGEVPRIEARERFTKLRQFRFHAVDFELGNFGDFQRLTQ